MAPLFSVVIPTCRRPAGLTACLARLAPGLQANAVLGPEPAGDGGTRVLSYEVIVSDAGADPACRQMLQEKFPWTTWVAAAGCGPGPNRNLGARAARAEWLAFVDDDCVPEPDWIAQLAAAMRPDVDIVEGAIHSPDLPDSPFWTAPVNTTGDAGWTANLCVRRAVFEKLRGFDPDLPETAEDMEFHFRSKHAGYRWVFAADAVVVHPPRHLTWAQLWRDTLRFRWWFMYRLKVGWGPGPEAGAWAGAWDVVSSLARLYARMTWHLVRDAARGRRRPGRRDAFLRLRDWLLLPVLAPYFWRWAMTYRRQLRARGEA